MKQWLEVSRAVRRAQAGTAAFPMIATVLAQNARSGRRFARSHGNFPIDLPSGGCRDEVVERMGFDSPELAAGRRRAPVRGQFFDHTDVRITTRWDESHFPSSLYGAMHECGHGLYEAGIAESLQRTPLGHAESLGLHESQSRMWENMVGRGREFCGVLAPRVAATFGGALAGLTADDLFRAVNRVQPSLIRVEADEVTYGMHIILRFELEQALIEGRLNVDDLPEAGLERPLVRGLLRPGCHPTTATAASRTVHWSAGLIGYFSTYALGNLIAGQLLGVRRISDDLPDLDGQIAAGELLPLREWLRENVHRHGAKFSTAEPARSGWWAARSRSSRSPPTSSGKLGDVYGLESRRRRIRRAGPSAYSAVERANGETFRPGSQANRRR